MMKGRHSLGVTLLALALAGCGKHNPKSTPSEFIVGFNETTLIDSLADTLGREQTDALRNRVSFRQILNTELEWSSRVFDFEISATNYNTTALLDKWKALAEDMLNGSETRFAHQGASPRNMQIIYWPKGKAAGTAHLFLTETREGGIRVIGTIYEY